MAQNIVGKIPDFTEDTPSPEVVVEEGKETIAEEVIVEEKVTPEPPAEKPAGNSVDTVVPSQGQDLEVAKNALQKEILELRKDISELRGQRREIKQDQLLKAEEQLDELKDLHPEDVTVIDRVLKAKGYLSKEDANKMFYDAVKNEELNKFLERYPEYKPENDLNDQNWSALQKELGFYKMPSDPHLVTQVLERAHRGISKAPSGLSAPQKRQITVASHGGGGAQRPSTNAKSFDPSKRAMLAQGGFTEEDIRAMESKL